MRSSSEEVGLCLAEECEGEVEGEVEGCVGEEEGETQGELGEVDGEDMTEENCLAAFVLKTA